MSQSCIVAFPELWSIETSPLTASAGQCWASTWERTVWGKRSRLLKMLPAILCRSPCQLARENVLPFGRNSWEGRFWAADLCLQELQLCSSTLDKPPPTMHTGDGAAQMCPKLIFKLAFLHVLLTVHFKCLHLLIQPLCVLQEKCSTTWSHMEEWRKKRPGLNLDRYPAALWFHTSVLWPASVSAIYRPMTNIQTCSFYPLASCCTHCQESFNVVWHGAEQTRCRFILGPSRDALQDHRSIILLKRKSEISFWKPRKRQHRWTKPPCEVLSCLTWWKDKAAGELVTSRIEVTAKRLK